VFFLFVILHLSMIKPENNSNLGLLKWLTLAAFSDFNERILSPWAVTLSYSACCSGVWLLLDPPETTAVVVVVVERFALLSFWGDDGAAFFGCFLLAWNNTKLWFLFNIINLLSCQMCSIYHTDIYVDNYMYVPRCALALSHFHFGLSWHLKADKEACNIPAGTKR